MCDPNNHLFLFPCSSSHLHRNVTLRILTCEPNLTGEEGYQDEADLFDEDPLNWMWREYGSQPSTLPHSTEREEKGLKKEKREFNVLGSGRKREDRRTEEEEERNRGIGDRRKIESKGSERKKEEKEREELGITVENVDTDRTKTRLNGNSKNNKVEIEGEGTGDRRERRETRRDVEEGREEIGGSGENHRNGGKKGEQSNISNSPAHNLPSHIVMFSVLSGKVKEFLSVHHYQLCHQLFHAHVNDGRRSTHIHVYCRLRTRG